MSLRFFQLILLLSGAFLVLTGLDVALGGMRTMGWLGANDFLDITNDKAFRVQDSHIRFFGGIWTGMGLLFWFIAKAPLRWRQTLYMCFVLIFLGGLARIASMDFDTVLGPDIIGSLIAEIIGMPVLGYWLSKL